MRRSRWKTLLWQGVGLLFYLAGMLLFLFVAVNTFFGPPGGMVTDLTFDDLVMLLLSVALIVTGRGISWKAGSEGAMTGMVGTIRDRGPEQSKLEELGYQIPPEVSDERDRAVVYEDGEVYHRCPECGTKNEQTYQYCSNCSSRLPE